MAGRAYVRGSGTARGRNGVRGEHAGVLGERAARLRRPRRHTAPPLRRRATPTTTSTMSPTSPMTREPVGDAHRRRHRRFLEALVLVSVTSSVGTCSITAHPTCDARKTRGRSGRDRRIHRTRAQDRGNGEERRSRSTSTNVTTTGRRHDPKQDTVHPAEDTTVKVPDGTRLLVRPGGRIGHDHDRSDGHGCRHARPIP